MINKMKSMMKMKLNGTSAGSANRTTIGETNTKSPMLGECLTGKIFLLLLVFSSIALNSCSQKPVLSPENRAATNILAAVASGNADKFNRLSVAEIRLFRECQDRDEIENIAKNKSSVILPSLRKWQQEGKEAGIDWSDYTVDRVEFEEEYDSDLGVNMANGYIYITSADKGFKIFFKHAVITDNGEWKWIELRKFQKIPINAEISILFSGIYECTSKFKYCLRFYPDGVVVEASTLPDADLTKVSKWLTPTNDKVSVGKYYLQDNRINFEVTSKWGTVQYSGYCDGNNLTLNWKSLINDNTGERIYNFVEIK